MREILKKQCKILAVRIALDKGSPLIGSGTILVCKQEKYALILTAAHVIDTIISSSKKVHLCFSDKDDVQQCLTLELEEAHQAVEVPRDGVGVYYLHDKYKAKNSGYPVNDGAIICIPYYEWMNGMPTFEISEPVQSEAYLVGFPERLDSSSDTRNENEFVRLRDDIYAKDVEITGNQRNYIVKNVIDYLDTFTVIQDKVMCLSGGGIFSEDEGMLKYHGAFVSEKKENTFYLTAQTIFSEIMEKNNLTSEFSGQIDFLLSETQKLFDASTDEAVVGWLANNLREFYKNITVESFSNEVFFISRILPCEGYRPRCLHYYTGKLLESVLIGRTYGIDPSQINSMEVPIPGYDGAVHLEYICSEETMEQIVSIALTEGAFSKKGIFRNRCIYVLNSKYMNETFGMINRKRCRRIVTSILDDKSKLFSNDPAFKEQVNKLLSEEHKNESYLLYSIIKGDLESADMGFVGIGRLHETMTSNYSKDTEETELFNAVKELLQNVWKG